MIFTFYILNKKITDVKIKLCATKKFILILFSSSYIMPFIIRYKYWNWHICFICKLISYIEIISKFFIFRNKKQLFIGINSNSNYCFLSSLFCIKYSCFMHSFYIYMTMWRMNISFSYIYNITFSFGEIIFKPSCITGFGSFILINIILITNILWI